GGQVDAGVGVAQAGGAVGGQADQVADQDVVVGPEEVHAVAVAGDDVAHPAADAADGVDRAGDRDAGVVAQGLEAAGVGADQVALEHVAGGVDDDAPAGVAGDQVGLGGVVAADG